jgi:hypothetical protein
MVEHLLNKGCISLLKQLPSILYKTIKVLILLPYFVFGVNECSTQKTYTK